NAGINRRHEIGEFPTDDFDSVIATNLSGPFILMRECSRAMKEAGYGRIINVISTSVITPILGLGVSNTVRGAMANWGRTMAAALGEFGITVNNLLPGFTDTDRLSSLFEGKAERLGTTPQSVRDQALATIPLGRIGAPEELAAAALFLASPAGGYVSGVNLPVDGGRVCKG
ncbi:MAG: SDR family oxidoreductase, partial [Planctomycetota bacterium]|nr:SDR family oxidoreductase [Planctomycetota bacterium]